MSFHDAFLLFLASQTGNEATITDFQEAEHEAIEVIRKRIELIKRSN